MVDSSCKKCRGTGRYMYDENHVTVCDACCTHQDGWHKIERGKDREKYMCKKGCGILRDSIPQSEDDLMELTKQALADALGREPTYQEILRAHAGFKRMAFVTIEHLKKIKDHE